MKSIFTDLLGRWASRSQTAPRRRRRRENSLGTVAGLEGRVLLSGISIANGIVTVDGTNTGDTVKISYENAAKTQIRVQAFDGYGNSLGLNV